jgi:hypothetical protein
MGNEEWFLRQPAYSAMDKAFLAASSVMDAHSLQLGAE